MNNLYPWYPAFRSDINFNIIWPKTIAGYPINLISGQSVGRVQKKYYLWIELKRPNNYEVNSLNAKVWNVAWEILSNHIEFEQIARLKRCLVTDEERIKFQNRWAINGFTTEMTMFLLWNEIIKDIERVNSLGSGYSRRERGLVIHLYFSTCSYLWPA